MSLKLFGSVTDLNFGKHNKKNPFLTFYRQNAWFKDFYLWLGESKHNVCIERTK